MDEKTISQDVEGSKPYPTKAQNKYPIVLVHGVCGWGRDELLGKYHYWGGFGDTQEYLKSKGYEVYTASIGPLSSNWDRAVELYYCIKGGRVDYGAVHAAKYEHKRYGRDYPGLYPKWDENHPVHIIGHSMGGPTPRYLIELLEKGDVQEQLFVPNDIEAPTSELFKGKKTNWIHSHTSITGVHNGALLAEDGLEFRHLLGNLFYKFAALAGLATTQWLYDFNLQQWGLQRDKGESFDSYWLRVMKSDIWTTNDNCLFDLTIEASSLQNVYASASKNIYYASYPIDCTNDGPANVRIPASNINEALKLPCIRAGLNFLDLPMGYQKWRYNDGLVSVPASNYPFGDKYVMMDPNNRKLAPKGVWDVHPVVEDQDHLSIVIPDEKMPIDQLYAFYEKIAKDLYCLPKE